LKREEKDDPEMMTDVWLQSLAKKHGVSFFLLDPHICERECSIVTYFKMYAKKILALKLCFSSPPSQDTSSFYVTFEKAASAYITLILSNLLTLKLVGYGAEIAQIFK
jgi:hypothetical protein